MIPRLVTLLLCALLSTVSSRDLANPMHSWQTAPRSVLQEHYFPYELCLLDNAAELNNSENIWNQTICRQHLDSAFSSLHVRCRIGSIQQHMNSGMCIDKTAGCLGIDQRKSLWYYDNRDSVKIDSAEYRAEDLFYRSLEKAGFVSARFTGDSMAVQLGQQLGCLGHRRNISALAHTTPAMFRDGPVPSRGKPWFFDLKHESCFVPLKSSLIRRSTDEDIKLCVQKPNTHIGLRFHPVAKWRLHLPENCTDDNGCALEYVSSKIDRAFKAAFRLPNEWPKTLLITPLPIIRKPIGEYQAYCKALYEHAKRLQKFGIAILVLGPLNQHFRTPRGMYDETISSTPPQKGMPLCGPLYNTSVHPEVTDFTAVMSQVHPDWREFIGFFDAGPYTVPLHDMHAEYGATGFSYDCTHYGFTPFLFGPIYHNLGLYIRKHYRRARFIP